MGLWWVGANIYFRWRSIDTLRPGQNCRHFGDDISKCITLNKNVSNSHWYFAGVYSNVSNWYYISISLDNGLAPNRRLVIIWYNQDLVYWLIYAPFGLDDLTQPDQYDETFQTIFLHTSMILDLRSTEMYSKVVIYNKSSLVWVMAWLRKDNKPFSEAMMV